jgi:4-amino-4-deoxy-L-arabinose transferase-like glycosyltransferase
MLSGRRFFMPRPRIWLLWLLLAGAVLRTFYLLEAQARSPAWGILLLDASLYDALARQIAAGDWLAGREVFSLPPLYPYLLAVGYRLGLSGGAVIGLQALLGLGNLALVWCLGKDLFGARVAGLASLLCLLYAPFLAMESKLMGTTLGVFLGLCLPRLLLTARRRDRPAQWVAAGALLGIASLARPETLLFAPLALA